MNAAATIDLPCGGKLGRFTLGVATLEPSISQPLPPRNEITEALKI